MKKFRFGDHCGLSLQLFIQYILKYSTHYLIINTCQSHGKMRENCATIFDKFALLHPKRPHLYPFTTYSVIGLLSKYDSISHLDDVGLACEKGQIIVGKKRNGLGIAGALSRSHVFPH